MNVLKRQGDVLLEKIAPSLEKVENLRLNHQIEGGVIAEGEVTGHAHKLVGADLHGSNRGILAVVTEDAKVVHEEHDTLELEPGVWLVHRQREYLGANEEQYVYD